MKNRWMGRVVRPRVPGNEAWAVAGRYGTRFGSIECGLGPCPASCGSMKSQKPGQQVLTGQRPYVAGCHFFGPLIGSACRNSPAVAGSQGRELGCLNTTRVGGHLTVLLLRELTAISGSRPILKWPAWQCQREPAAPCSTLPQAVEVANTAAGLAPCALGNGPG